MLGKVVNLGILEAVQVELEHDDVGVVGDAGCGDLGGQLLLEVVGQLRVRAGDLIPVLDAILGTGLVVLGLDRGVHGLGLDVVKGGAVAVEEGPLVAGRLGGAAPLLATGSLGAERAVIDIPGKDLFLGSAFAVASRIPILALLKSYLVSISLSH